MRTATGVDAPQRVLRSLETFGAWVLGVLWVMPLLYAFWTAFHPAAFSPR
jgi:sn-glycerol 3-phosphate transport system permease protein